MQCSIIHLLPVKTFEWDFGDGTTSTEEYPTHIYPTPGVYTIKLVARDPRTCNVIDSTTRTITVYDIPTAAFSYLPVTPKVNKPTVFSNNSIDGVRHIWYFGDGDSVETNTMEDVSHQYNVTGDFIATLVTFNVAGCPDTTTSGIIINRSITGCTERIYTRKIWQE